MNIRPGPLPREYGRHGLDDSARLPLEAPDANAKAPEIPMTRFFRATSSAVGLFFGAVAIAPCVHAESRGELLYSTHCIACHSSKMHWRDKKVATDWTSLKFQVRRWQSAASLGWSESDIQDVTRYLNESIYRYAQTSDPLTLIGPVAPQPAGDAAAAQRPQVAPRVHRPLLATYTFGLSDTGSVGEPSRR